MNVSRQTVWFDALDDVQVCIRGEAAPQNEHQTRRSVIDPLLHALGWTASMLQPHREEYAVMGINGMKFLDYLCVDPATGFPKIIIEAKQWKEEPPRPARGQQHQHLERYDPTMLIMTGIHALATGVPKSNWPLVGSWMEWLDQVRGYTRFIKTEFGSAPTRVAITNGRWLMIVKNPEKVFLSNSKISADDIKFYDENALNKFDEIVGLLGFESICSKWRPLIKPNELPDYLNGLQVSACFRALAASHIKNTDPFRVTPVLKVWPALLILRSDGTILCVMSSEITVPIAPSPGDLEPDIENHLDEVQEAHRRLDQETASQLVVSETLKPLSEFPGFVSKVSPRAKDLAYGEKAHAMWENLDHGGSIYVVALGRDIHFIERTSHYVDCPYHSDDSCGAASKQYYYTLTSRDERALFVSRDVRYCGHRDVRGKRPTFCVVRDVELQLCCQNCKFLSVCWEGQKSAMPCM